MITKTVTLNLYDDRITIATLDAFVDAARIIDSDTADGEIEVEYDNGDGYLTVSVEVDA